MTVWRSPRRGEVLSGITVKLKPLLVSKLSNMTANEEQSKKRGTKRVGTSVDDALIAAGHVNDEIDWKSVGTFGCYHCPHAFSKIEGCAFVFWMKCHEEKCG